MGRRSLSIANFRFPSMVTCGRVFGLAKCPYGPIGRGPDRDIVSPQLLVVGSVVVLLLLRRQRGAAGADGLARPPALLAFASPVVGIAVVCRIRWGASVIGGARLAY
jgi:hypothetical protein